MSMHLSKRCGQAIELKSHTPHGHSIAPKPSHGVLQFGYRLDSAFLALQHAEEGFAHLTQQGAMLRDKATSYIRGLAGRSPAKGSSPPSTRPRPR